MLYFESNQLTAHNQYTHRERNPMHWNWNIVQWEVPDLNIRIAEFIINFILIWK